MGLHFKLTRNRDTWYKIITVSGGFLLITPEGGLWTWGNMSVYVLSYMRKNGAGRSELESPWVISLYLLSWAVSMMIAGSICRLVGRRMTLLFGIALLDGGLFLSYFATGVSVYAIDFTNGAMTGFGFGLIFSVVWLFIIEWADKDEGTLSAIILSSTTVGGAVGIQIVSRYVNPDNKTPNLRFGPIEYFTQVDVIDKVPKTYLILGSFSLALHLIGFCMLIDKPKPESTPDKVAIGMKNAKNAKNAKNMKNAKNAKNAKITRSAKSENTFLTQTTFDRTKSSKKYSEESNVVHNIILSNDLNNGVGVKSPQQQKEENGDVIEIYNGDVMEIHNGDVRGLDNNVANVVAPETDSHVQAQVGQGGKSGHEKKDYTPLEVMKSVKLYLLWFVLMWNDFAYLVFSNYYKTFGELFIANDHRLADMGTALAIAVAVTRVFWGYLIDRAGVKWMMIIFSASLSIFFSFFFFTPMLSEYAYCVWCVILASVDCGLYANYALAALKLFGEKHFSFNLGLVMSSTIVLNLGAPPIVRIVLHSLGWFYLFFICAVTNFFSLVLVILALPRV